MSTYRRIHAVDSNGVTHVTFVDRRIIDQRQIEEMAEDLARWIDQNPSTVAVLDFSNVEFLSSAGLGKFLILHSSAKKNHCRLVLTNLQPAIHDLFTVTRLHEVLEIKPDLASALQSVQG